MPKLFRKVIRIRAEDSPNVRFALAQRRAGIAPTGEQLLEGVLTWEEFLDRRATWDEIRQCIGLDGLFYQGAEILLFPPAWLLLAEQLADRIGYSRHRVAKGIGIDPGEGVANTSMCAVDEMGIIELVGRKTPDTAGIYKEAIAFARDHGVTPEDSHKVVADAGGQGKMAIDLMRQQGWTQASTVSFGESMIIEPHRGMTYYSDRVENREERGTYFNRRSEMYYEGRILIDPSISPRGFAIPGERWGPIYKRLRHQLSKIPLTYDEHGRVKLLPKNRPAHETGTSVKRKYLVDLIGYSPDEADAFVIAVHAMRTKKRRVVAGAI